MLRTLAVAGVLSFLLAAPALAIGPECETQLEAVDGMLQAREDVPQEIQEKRQEAERLCVQGQDMEAQQVLREVREELGEVMEEGEAPGQSPGAQPGMAPDRERVQEPGRTRQQ